MTYLNNVLLKISNFLYSIMRKENLIRVCPPSSALQDINITDPRIRRQSKTLMMLNMLNLNNSNRSKQQTQQKVIIY